MIPYLESTVSQIYGSVKCNIVKHFGTIEPRNRTKKSRETRSQKICPNLTPHPEEARRAVSKGEGAMGAARGASFEMQALPAPQEGRA
jgi:hypothetical protein